LPIVADPVVTVIRDGNRPTPEDVDVIGTEHDCRFLNFEFEILQITAGTIGTFLYAETESNKEVCIEVRHPYGTALPDVSSIAGSRVQCAGVLGLKIQGGAFVKPGQTGNVIQGYKVYCNSPDDLKIVSKGNQQSDSAPAQNVGLSFLARQFPRRPLSHLRPNLSG